MELQTEVQPNNGDIRTELSPNNRAKCQLCKLKIAKDCWRFQLAVAEMYSSSGRCTWQSVHASCYLRNVSDVDRASRHSTQSMPYYSSMPAPGWNDAPRLSLPSTEEGASIEAAIAASDPSEDLNLDQLLPTPALQACFSATINASIAGSDALVGDHRLILEKFCFYGRLTPSIESMLDGTEAAEADLHGDNYESKDPLKSKFTQYSPNSQAHCRDCQKRIENGEIRVGASVFSSSSRHASFSLNYWCIECMCARPAIKRASRLYPDELEKILPGAELLAQVDIERICTMLKIALPSDAALSSMAEGRKRQTRSGRKFGNWGGEETVQTEVQEDSGGGSSKRSRR
jgi:hypothetical protein